MADDTAPQLQASRARIAARRTARAQLTGRPLDHNPPPPPSADDELHEATAANPGDIRPGYLAYTLPYAWARISLTSGDMEMYLELSPTWESGAESLAQAIRDATT